MAFIIFDYVGLSGRNEFLQWAEGLQPPQQARLQQQIDLLVMNGTKLLPGFPPPGPVGGLKKLKVRGNVQLRPLLCLGPIENDKEYTMLAGAIEVGRRLTPVGVVAKAVENKKLVIADHEHRRKPHEKFC